MGRKRWWRGGPELLTLCALLHAILGDGDVGCLFDKNLCKSGAETCYNDLAFGRCVELYGNLDDQDLFQYSLDPKELELFRLQLERLEIDGYQWTHPYTQCVLQGSLYVLRYRSKHDLEPCRHLKKHGERQFGNDDNVDGDTGLPIAIVKFTPSDGNPHGDFADELYYPPGMTRRRIVPSLLDEEYSRPPHTEEKGNPNFHNLDGGWSVYQDLNAIRDGGRDYVDEKKLRKKSLAFDSTDRDLNELRHQSLRTDAKGIPRKSYVDFSPRDFTSYDQVINMENNLKDSARLLASDAKTLPSEIVRATENFKEHPNFKDNGNRNDYEKTFARKYKFSKVLSRIEFLNKNPALTGSPDTRPRPHSRSYDIDVNNSEANLEDGSAMVSSEHIDKSIAGALSGQNAMYTEGGLVQPLRQTIVRSETPEDVIYDENDDDDDDDDDLGALLLAGFKRRERLDVKKPGPPFATNNYAFKTQSPPAVRETNDDIGESRENEAMRVPSAKKKLTNESGRNLDDLGKFYKNVDMDHVYIQFKQQFLRWKDGEVVVEEVGNLLGLQPGTLTDIRVGRAEVTFLVKDNDKKLNASAVVDEIDNIRGKLRNNLGVEVVRAGIGDKATLPPMLVVENPEMNSAVFGAIVAAGTAATVAAAIVTIIIARRVAESRSKLAGLSATDPEASKDYQDLCRVRMQAKQPTEKPDSPRVVSLSRESESNNSPSSRSSTSSWSEEPALSNMDISTGHMVLSYMEDHLKNKDRLDQEWTALCAYEAEPSSEAIALKEANAEHNRPGAALPYDHSRVVLNDLANIDNSDYINASTITDHDPRNPAYIATQGPLPQTAADFWQLVWEQGSVVIVMLTRLTEEGRAMCHRYWPEEGSELYHIYEVHLVSEHIWCDDYLVRSFYLKNLRTGETRTVTQFHFLSWPENGVPHSTKALLEFRRKVNKSYRGRSCPIVVHCSDGAGRTGTYCLIDMVLNRMAKGAKEIDIAATLEHIRDQRPAMVATKQQFEFVLMAVAEEVHAILKALPIPPVEKSPAPAITTASNVSAPACKSDQ